MSQKEWIKFGKELKNVLGMELEPVALMRTRDSCGPQAKKVRICKAIIEAAQGGTFEVCRHNNACFGASWHLGFKELKDPKVKDMVRRFVVEGEKLFSTYEALDKAISQMGEVLDSSDKCFRLTPVEKAELQPELVIFALGAEGVCRLLTLAIFDNGIMPDIKIGGPTCRMTIMYPLVSGKLNISFYDYTARKICNLDKDIMLVSIPYKLIGRIVGNINSCSAGRAKVEYPQDFRDFLKKRLGG